MARRNEKAELTRQILTGVSLGALTIVILGCTPTTPVAATGLPARELCERAVETGDRRFAEELLLTYPTDRCTGPTLAVLPRESLREISPSVLQRVPRSVLLGLPANVRSALRIRLEDGTQVANADPGGY
jgi:hypothetical protein